MATLEEFSSRVHQNLHWKVLIHRSIARSVGAQCTGAQDPQIIRGIGFDSSTADP